MRQSLAISIVVPAYNEEKLISPCLTSLLKQDFSFPYEIIVVNNNSTDKTESIAQSFHVKVITEEMQSVVAARQRGLTTARADIIVGADADCVYPPGWLQAIYRHFADKNVVAVGGPGIAEINPLWAHLWYRFGFFLVYVWYRLTGKVFYLSAFNFAFRRSTFLGLGGYHMYLDFGGDEWDPLSRLQNIGKVIYDKDTYMYVSMRRYRVGFVRHIIVHAFYYYFLNYLLARIFKRTVIRAQPVRNI